MLLQSHSFTEMAAPECGTGRYLLTPRTYFCSASAQPRNACPSCIQIHLTPIPLHMRPQLVAWLACKCFLGGWLSYGDGGKSARCVGRRSDKFPLGRSKSVWRNTNMWRLIPAWSCQRRSESFWRPNKPTPKVRDLMNSPLFQIRPAVTSRLWNHITRNDSRLIERPTTVNLFSY